MLHLLGSAGVSVDGAPVRSPTGAAFAWAAVLALEYGNRCSRSQLAAFLHEDRESSEARPLLRVHLRRIRAWERHSGIRLFRAAGEIIARTDDCEPSDLDRFLSVESIEREADLLSVLDSYAGDLLPGVDPEGSDFRHWLNVQRANLRERFVALVRQGIAVVPKGRVRDRAMRTLSEFARDEQSAPPRIEPRPRAPASDLLERIAAKKPRVAIGLPAPAASSLATRLGVSLAEEIALALYRHRSLATIAPHTMRQLSLGPAVVDDAAVLGVDYVASCRVEPDGDRVRFSIALSRFKSGELVWSTSTSIAASDSNRTRIVLANAVAREVVDVVEFAELAQPLGAVNDDAYLHYLRGKQQLRSLDLANVRRARHSLERSVDSSRTFAPAHALLARANCMEWLLLRRSEDELLTEACKQARVAIELDPFDAAGHHELAKVTLYTDGPEESLHHFRQAERIAPYHADILADTADTLNHNGQMEEANEHMALALDLNPLAPDEYRWTDGEIRFFRGEYGAAVATLRSMRDDEPAARIIAAAAAMAGNMKLAQVYRDRELTVRPNFTIAGWKASVRRKGDGYVDRFVEGLRRAGFC